MQVIKRCCVGFHKEKKLPIVPVFLPFLGCPQICIYCNQGLQTGEYNKNPMKSSNFIQSKLIETEKLILSMEKEVELAFYGGTFTALDRESQASCLSLVEKYKKIGLIKKARCSTRPDACDRDVLSYINEKGIDMVELGVQSFDSTALHLSQRGYSGELAEKGCENVHLAGMELGIQLLPNMLGVSPDVFLKDVDKALQLKPANMRFYPCLVVEGTQLAEIWKKGEHKIWDFDECVNTLAQALYQTWQAQVPVIRIGVAPEPSFYEQVIAGIWHNAFGQLVQVKALQIAVQNSLETILNAKDTLSNVLYEKQREKKVFLLLPEFCKGYYMAKRDASFWSSLGFARENIRFTAEKEALFAFE